MIEDIKDRLELIHGRMETAHTRILAEESNCQTKLDKNERLVRDARICLEGAIDLILGAEQYLTQYLSLKEKNKCST